MCNAALVPQRSSEALHFSTILSRTVHSAESKREVNVPQSQGQGDSIMQYACRLLQQGLAACSVVNIHILAHPSEVVFGHS